ncbi:MAG: hypothetical protein AUG44_08805 [Actinobacteria bacterium 13_1_20CM_3_71_11]|nr:MAG: hypothetical protein AUG44_08805 [Actinobacteria bacterium 13_1_20CM_3_71_11]
MTTIANVVLYDVEAVSHQSSVSASAGDEVSLSVSCPTGKVAIGGGGDTDHKEAVVTASVPTSFNAAGLPTAWQLRVLNTSGSTLTITVTTWAITARVAGV